MTTIATECNVCPKGIKACAHLGDRVVWLVDNAAFTKAHGGGAWLGRRWAVDGPDTIGECSCLVRHIVMPGNSRAAYLHTDSFPAAEAEFERLCALLRAEA